jgi:hypothetical protein
LFLESTPLLTRQNSTLSLLAAPARLSTCRCASEHRHYQDAEQERMCAWLHACGCCFRLGSVGCQSCWHVQASYQSSAAQQASERQQG